MNINKVDKVFHNTRINKIFIILLLHFLLKYKVFYHTFLEAYLLIVIKDLLIIKFLIEKFTLTQYKKIRIKKIKFKRIIVLTIKIKII